MNILIIEDNVLYRNNLKKDLEQLKYDVDIILDFKEVENTDFSKYSLIIVDINLPGLDGRNLIKIIKANSNAKTIMLTSSNNNEDEFTSLKLGADDYIIKPHYLPVLDIKIKHLTNSSSNIITINKEKINTETLKINDKIQLTAKEYKIIICLHNKNGQECSKNELLKVLWESDFFVEVGALYTMISRLRKKLKSTSINIVNTKGGYKIAV